jgi:hypothetical protein
MQVFPPFLSRHSRESGNLAVVAAMGWDEIPAFAGMTMDFDKSRDPA